MTVEEMEKSLRDEARVLVEKEPLSRLMLEEQVLSRKDFADMLGVTLACQLAGEIIDRSELEKMFSEIYKKYPDLLLWAAKDIKATVLLPAPARSSRSSSSRVSRVSRPTAPPISCGRKAVPSPPRCSRASSAASSAWTSTRPRKSGTGS